MTVTKMACPKCGAPMNYHAGKPVRGTIVLTASDTQTESDLEMAGVSEIYTCPGCKWVEAKQIAFS
jgi:predicted RNA-binding Zn-ribbon protein involved in translation (DUF1610 family)